MRVLRAVPWLLPLALMTAAHAGAPPGHGSRVIAGVAVASTGPVADVEVRATHEERTVTTRTDAHGHFVFQGLSDEWWTLTTSRGAELGALAVAVVTGDERDVVLELGPPRSVRGTVRGASGTPLQGVRVEAGLQGEYGPLHAREARTGSDGQFEIEVPGFSPIAVQVRAPGYLPRYVASAPATGKLDLVLEPSQVLRGVVTDSQGTPVPGVRVRLKRYGRMGYPMSCTGPDPLTATTDDRGAFKVEGLGRGRYSFLLQPRAHVWRSGDIELPTREVLWTLPVGVRASFAITGTGGTPAPASITLTGPIRDPAFHSSDRTAETDAAGAATLEGLVPGSYWLTARVRSGAEERSLSRQVSVSGTGAPVTLSLQGGHRLRGSVTDTRGRPLRGVEVSLMGVEAMRADFTLRRKGLNGTFTLDSLPEGEHLVTASAEGYEDTSIKVRVPASAPVRLVLPRTSDTLASGRVLDARGRPLRSFQVAYDDVEHAGGRFAMPVTFHRETAHLVVSASGFAPRVLILGPRRLALGDVRLGAGRTLTGRVETPDGRGLAGATLRCRWAHLPRGSDPTACYGKTLPGGSLHLTHVPEEPVLLVLEHPGWPRTQLLVPAGITEARVRLSPGLTVQGRVTDLLGQPLEAGDVHVKQDGEDHFADIHSDGTYLIRLPPGRGTIEVLNRKGEPGMFEGTEGQTARVDLVVPSGD